MRIIGYFSFRLLFRLSNITLNCNCFSEMTLRSCCAGMLHGSWQAALSLRLFPVQTHHHTTFYILLAMTVLVVVILALSLVPAISIREPAAIPVTGNSVFPGYAQRHPELIMLMSVPADTTDYFFRHSEFGYPADTDDQTDYFFRHP
jgi:hypothetical protein